MVATKCLENQTSKYISSVLSKMVDTIVDAIEDTYNEICQGGDRKIELTTPLEIDGLGYKLGGLQVENDSLYTLDEKLSLQEHIDDLTLDAQVMVMFWFLHHIKRCAKKKEGI